MMNQEQLEQEVVRLADAWATAELQSDTLSLRRSWLIPSSGSDRSDSC